MYRSSRVWVARALGAAAIALAGLLGGWVFRPATPAQPSTPVAPVENQAEVASEPPESNAQDQTAAKETRPLKENHLAHETSPYLLLHKYNPIDWYPWGSEALERAKREDKLI